MGGVFRSQLRTIYQDLTYPDWYWKELILAHLEPAIEYAPHLQYLSLGPPTIVIIKRSLDSFNQISSSFILSDILWLNFFLFFLNWTHNWQNDRLEDKTIEYPKENHGEPCSEKDNEEVKLCESQDWYG